MNILIINGSPKGKNSITLQTCLYMKKLNPSHEYRVIHAGAMIRALEMDFSKAASLINKSDVIIFSYPVYTFMAPCQLHRFIELMKQAENKGQISTKGKIYTQITTSKHFYDTTAQAYIDDNCRDMGMKGLRGLYADMDDLTTKKGRQQAAMFFDHLFWSVSKPVNKEVYDELKDVVVVADLAADDASLKKLIDRFMAKSGGKAKLVNIHDFPFRGGCISCFNCAAEGKCIYTDGFQELLRDEIQTGAAIVLAFSIKDHSMGSVFKTYDDRQFCNGHRTVTMGMPFGYLVSGELSKEENLRTVIEARAQVGGNYLAGVATDEDDYAKSVDSMASELAWSISHHYSQPSNFYGVGGMKIFRDLIWQMQGLMRADYKFFKKNGQMDFPQNNMVRMLLMYLVGAMMNNKKLKAKIGTKMNEGMLMPYKKALKDK